MSQNRLQRLNKYFLIFVLISILSLLYIGNNLNTINAIFGFNQNDNSVNLFTILEMKNNSNHFCIIPHFSYDDKFAMSYLKKDMKNSQSSFKACESDNEQDSSLIDRFLLIASEANETYKIRLNTSLIEAEFKLNNITSLKCSLQRFEKKVNVSEKSTEMILPIYNLDFKSSELVVNQTGFYYLECKNLKSKLFSHVYIVYPYRMSKLIEQNELYRDYAEKLTARFSNSKAKLLLKDSYASECETNQTKPNKMMNLLIIGIDSMSHNNFKRVFPLTYKYLKEKESLIFDNFNSIGHNTYPNMFAFLGGLISFEGDNNELNLTSETHYALDLDSKFHDNFPFIWKEFQKLGYVTMLQEDDPAITCFNYNKPGFRYFPTTLYGRAYWLKYYEKRSGPDKCNYKQPTYQTWLNRIDEFITKMNSNKINRETPYFSLNFLTEYTHSHLAVPQRFDLKLKELLTKLNDKGYLNNTMLIMMADHGSKLTYYAYATEMGKIERFRPLFSLKLPSRFTGTSYLKEALNNRNKLVSYYDAYQTLRHFLHLNKFGMNENESCRKKFSLNTLNQRNLRGISLFNEIPTNRTCIDALITFTFCSCFKEIELKENEFVDKTKQTFESIGMKVTEYINNLTEPSRYKCAAFKFNRTVSFKRMLVNNIEAYKTSFVLEPGKAWFEAKVEISNTSMILINGHPTRVSPYGNQSICTKDSLLVNYCFCI